MNLKRIAAAWLLAAGLFGADAAQAASTINTSVPAPNAPLQSAPIRNNFLAAASDYNAMLGQFATNNCNSISQPTIGQYCLNNGSTPAIQYFWSGTTWVQVSAINLSTGVPTPYLGPNNVTGNTPIVATFGGGNYVIACTTCLTTGSYANPTALVGPTAVNGSASTVLRSDSAPAINLTATYPWTGPHSISPTSAAVPAFQINTLTSSLAQGIIANSIIAGTDATRAGIFVHSLNVNTDLLANSRDCGAGAGLCPSNGVLAINHVIGNGIDGSAILGGRQSFAVTTVLTTPTNSNPLPQYASIIGSISTVLGITASAGTALYASNFICTLHDGTTIGECTAGETDLLIGAGVTVGRLFGWNITTTLSSHATLYEGALVIGGGAGGLGANTGILISCGSNVPGGCGLPVSPQGSLLATEGAWKVANAFDLASITIGAKSVVTITSANPGVVSWTAHGLTANAAIYFSTTGALPTNLTAFTTYYVRATGLGTDTFQVSATPGGAAINTTAGAQSGVQIAYVKACTVNLTAGCAIDPTGAIYPGASYVGFRANVAQIYTATGSGTFGLTISAVNNSAGTYDLAVVGIGGNAVFALPKGTADAELASGAVRAYLSGGLTVGSPTGGNPGAGGVNVGTGYRINGAAASGNVLRGNGTNFVSAVLAAADLSNGTSGSGAVCLVTSCVMVTPNIGVAGGTSLTTTSFVAAGGVVWSQKVTSIARVRSGDDPSSVSGSLNGIELLAFSNGSNYFDSKVITAGSLNFRIGANTEPGSQRTWLLVDGATGNATFIGTVNATGFNGTIGATTPAAGTFTTVTSSGTVLINGGGALSLVNSSTTASVFIDGNTASTLRFRNVGLTKWELRNGGAAGTDTFDIYNEGLALSAMTVASATSNVTFSGASVTINPATGGALMVLKPTTTAQQALVQYFDGSTQIWFEGKQTDNSFVISDSANTINAVQVIAGATAVGRVKVNYTTPATSTVTGSFQTLGGVGIAGAAFIGSTLSVAGYINMTTSGTAPPQAGMWNDGTSLKIRPPSGGGYFVNSANSAYIFGAYDSTGICFCASPSDPGAGSVKIIGTGTVGFYVDNGTVRGAFQAGPSTVIVGSSSVHTTQIAVAGGVVATFAATQVVLQNIFVAAMTAGAGTNPVCWNTVGGAITAAAASCTVSDGRLKDIDGANYAAARIDNALERLLTIDGLYYHWKDGQHRGYGRQIGVIAQQVQVAFPELVSADPDGMLSMDYQRLTAPIIEAMRELKAVNDNLRSDNENIRAELKAIRTGTK